MTGGNVRRGAAWREPLKDGHVAADVKCDLEGRNGPQMAQMNEGDGRDEPRMDAEGHRWTGMVRG